MADKIDPREDNKDAESGEPVQLDKDKDQQQGGQRQPQQPQQPKQPDQQHGGAQHEGGQKR